jgi:hypothetical protein
MIQSASRAALGVSLRTGSLDVSYGCLLDACTYGQRHKF